MRLVGYLYEDNFHHISLSICSCVCHTLRMELVLQLRILNGAWYGVNITRSHSACILYNFLPPVKQTWQLYQFRSCKWYWFVVCELGNFKAPGTVGQVAGF